MPGTTDTRGAVNIVDVIMTTAVLIALVLLAPYFYTFTGMVSSEADQLTALLLQLVVPLLFLALIVSVGVSARRGP